MPKLNAVLIAAALAVLLPPSVFSVAAAAGTQPAFRTAMMDMMPMEGSGAMPQPAPGGPAMPGMGAKMDDDKMRMGGGMPAQGQTQMPAPASAAMPQSAQGGGGMPGMAPKMDDDKMRMGGGMPAQGQNQMPMAGPPMMEMMKNMQNMMQNMMRMGAAQQGLPSMQGGATAGGGQPAGSSAARLEGRIAFLRTELRITGAQAPAWENFATALRAAREHLDAARAALQDSGSNADPMARLKSFESHLRERADAIHMTQMAFTTLHAQLDDAQKQQATTTMLPFIGAY